MNSAAMHTVNSGLLIVGVTVVTAVIAVFVVRKLKSYQAFKENNEFAGVTYPFVGLVYGVFLAFTIVIAWGKFSEAEHCAIYEITHLSQLWRNAQAFDDDRRDRIQDKLIDYVKLVINKEWDAMSERGEADEVTRDAYEEIWQCYYECEPKGDRQTAFFNESIGHMSEVGRYRRQRIMFSSYEIPGIMWVFVIIGGLITISLNYLIGTRSAWSQAIINALIAALIAFSIFLVFSLQHPFTGDVSIEKKPFIELLDDFKERKQKQTAAKL